MNIPNLKQGDGELPTANSSSLHRSSAVTQEGVAGDDADESATDLDVADGDLRKGFVLSYDIEHEPDEMSELSGRPICNEESSSLRSDFASELALPLENTPNAAISTTRHSVSAQNGAAAAPPTENEGSSRAPSVMPQDSATAVDGDVPTLNVRTTMARALGLPGCDFESHPFNRHKSMCSPNLKDLKLEFKRRCPLLGINLGRSSRHQFLLPSVHSNKEAFTKWLRSHPIKGEDEIRKLRDLVDNIRDRVLAAPRFPRQRPARRQQHQPIGTSEEDKEAKNSSHSRDIEHGVQELSSNSNGESMSHVNRNGVDAENNTEGDDLRIAGADMVIAGGDDNLTPRVLMARALGLPGCDFRDVPFQAFRRTRPTRPQLYAEAKRRFGLLEIDISKSDRSLLPAHNTKKGPLISWLADHPIPADHPEVKRLRLQVERLRGQLQPSAVDDNNIGDNHQVSEALNPELPQPIVPQPAADVGAENHLDGNDWRSLSTLNWSGDSDDSIGVGTIEPILTFAPQPSSVLDDEAITGRTNHNNGELSERTGGDWLIVDVEEQQTSHTNDDTEVSMCPDSAFRGDQSVDEVTSIMNGSVILSASSSLSRDRSDLEDVVSYGALGSRTDVSSGNSSGESKGFVSSESGRSPISSASRVDGSSNPSSNARSSRDTGRLTATSKELLRLRGGRGLATLEESRVVEFQVQLRPCGTKEGLAETDIVSAMSGGPASYSALLDDAPVTGLPTVFDEDDSRDGGWKKLVRRTEETGDISSLIQIMANHPMVVEVQTEGLDVLWSWALGQDSKKMLVEAGAIPIILAAMRRHQSVPSVQRRGCLTLGNLAPNNLHNKDLIVQAIPIILQAMRQHPFVPKIQRYACYALGKLATNNVHNQNLIAEAGAIPIIVHAIRQHHTVPDIRKYGCYAIGNLAANNLHNKDLIVEADAIPVILQAMREHQSVPDIQQYGCLALGNLAADNLQNKHLIAEVGAIPIILLAMRQHQSVPDIQDNGCYALGNLAANNLHNKGLIVEAQAIPIILQAMRQHQSVPDIQEYGSLALGNLAADNLHNQNLITGAGVVPVIRQAMRQHHSVPNIQQYSCLALGNLAANNPHCQNRISEGGIIPIILQTMSQHRSVPKIQRYGCYALGNLAANNRHNQKLISEVGALPIILEAMRSHPSVPAIQENGCYALSLLAANNVHNQNLIAKAGAIPTILQAMTQHQSVPEIQRHACIVLRAFSLNHAMQELISPAVRQCVKRAQAQFPHLGLPGLSSWISMGWW